jgi:hypothetical protein
MAELTNAELIKINADLVKTNNEIKEKLESASRKIESLQKKVVDVTKSLHARVLDSEFSRIAHSMGFPPEAVPDALNHVEQNWTVAETGEPILKKATGIDDPSPERWMADQKKTRFSYLFRGGQQQAGGGGSSGGFSGERNPWEAKNWDDMAQVAVMRANPEKAKQLAAAAGSRIGALRPDTTAKPAY